MHDGDGRYVVVSADCHAGATLDTYRAYLEARHLDEFEAWRRGRDASGAQDDRRNFDGAVRQADLEGDGIVAEVLFPNTVSPFHPGTPLLGARDVADARELELRWAGIRAHNRWLADFCRELPGRRAGVAEILLEDVEAAVAEIRWAKEAGLQGGILLPNPNADSKVPQLHAPLYEPIWAACEELGLPVHVHGGGGGPNLGPYPSTPMMMFLEFSWYAQRPLVRLIFSGVLERHPRLTLVFTETGNAWVPQALRELDWYHGRVARAKAGSIEAIFGGSVKQLSLKPSEYWARQCYLGASFLSARDCATRHRTGVERVMWGADYPHREGTHPYTRQAYRLTFAGVERREIALMLGLNAVRAYGFDLALLERAAARLGPTFAEVAEPLDASALPDEAVSMALRTD